MTCAECSTLFVPRQGNQRYCSEACRYRRPRGEATCGYCLTSFVVRQSKGASFCSREHATLAANVGKAVPVAYGTCSCGRAFVARLGRSRFCADASCARARAAVATAARYVARPPRVGPCAECGTQTARQGTAPGRNLYCSERCSRHASKRLRRHALRDRPREVIGLAEIARRDGGRCQLCQRKVPDDRAVPHPMAGTLDHIIPVAEGGAHIRSNVQLAHFLCNSQRRAGGTVQLRWAS